MRSTLLLAWVMGADLYSPRSADASISSALSQSESLLALMKSCKIIEKLSGQQDDESRRGYTGMKNIVIYAVVTRSIPNVAAPLQSVSCVLRYFRPHRSRTERAGAQ